MTASALRTIPPFIGLLRILIILLIFMFALAFFGQLNPYLLSRHEVASVVGLGQRLVYPLLLLVNLAVPHWGGFDLTNILMIAIFCGILYLLDVLVCKIKFKVRYLQNKEKLDSWRAARPVVPNSNLYAELEQKLSQLNQAPTEPEANRLHKEFMELKRRLESKSRYLAFLSMDIVDSTGMKTEEDKSLIQLDFLRFKKTMQKNIDNYACVKSSWTPDGAMCCFNSVEAAVGAAKACLIDLARFNKEEKQITRDFIIRCGVHGGMIYFEELLPLEEISDEVIDIAGHMQKNASPGSIAISKACVKPVEDTIGFRNTGKIVDNQEVYEWRAEA